MDNKIFLVGGRATGKTTIGKLLSERLKLEFIDTDKLIESLAGQTISEIVENNGWSTFREKEHDILENLGAQNHLIIATGGGAILHQDIWPKIKERSLVVWLKADNETMRARMQNDAKSNSQRPSLTGDDILKEAEKVMAERYPLYEKSSHLQINSKQSVDVILSILEEEFSKIIHKEN